MGKRIRINLFSGGISKIVSPQELPENTHQKLDNRILDKYDRLETIKQSALWQDGDFVAELTSLGIEADVRLFYTWYSRFKITENANNQTLDYVIIVYADSGTLPLPDGHTGEDNINPDNNRQNKTGKVYIFYDNNGIWESKLLFEDYSFPDITLNTWGLTICDGINHNNLRYVEITNLGILNYGEVGLPCPINQPQLYGAFEPKDVVEKTDMDLGMAIPGGVVEQHAYTLEDAFSCESNPSPLSSLRVSAENWDIGYIQQLWYGNIDESEAYTYTNILDKIQRRVTIYELRTWGGNLFTENTYRRLKYINLYRRWIAHSEGTDPWTTMKLVHRFPIPENLTTQYALQYVVDNFPQLNANPDISWENDNQIKGDYLQCDRDIVFVANSSNKKIFPFAFANTCEINIANDNGRQYAINYHVEIKISAGDIAGFGSTEWDDIAVHPNYYRIFDIDMTTPCRVLYKIETGYIYLIIYIPHGLIANQSHTLYLCWGSPGVSVAWSGEEFGKFLGLNVTNRVLTDMVANQLIFTKSRARNLNHLICMTNEESIGINATSLYNKANNHIPMKPLVGNASSPAEDVFGFTGIQIYQDTSWHLCGNPIKMTYKGYQQYDDTYYARNTIYDYGIGTDRLAKVTGYRKFTIVGTVKSGMIVSGNNYYHDLLMLKTADHTYSFGIYYYYGGVDTHAQSFFLQKDFTNTETISIPSGGDVDDRLTRTITPGFHLTYVLSFDIGYGGTMSVKLLAVVYDSVVPTGLGYLFGTFSTTHGQSITEIESGLDVSLPRPVFEGGSVTGSNFYGCFDFYRDTYFDNVEDMSYLACRKPYYPDNHIGYSMEDQANHGISFNIEEPQQATGIMRWSDIQGRVYPNLSIFPCNAYIKAHIIIPAIYDDATRTSLMLFTEKGNRKFIAIGDPNEWYKSAYLTDNMVEMNNENLLVNRESVCRINNMLIYRSYGGVVLCDLNFQVQSHLLQDIVDDSLNFDETCQIFSFSIQNLVLIVFHNFAHPSQSRLFFLDLDRKFMPIEYKPYDADGFRLCPTSVSIIGNRTLFLNHKWDDSVHSCLPYEFQSGLVNEIQRSIKTRRIYIENFMVRKIRIKFLDSSIQPPDIIINDGEIPTLEFVAYEGFPSDPQQITIDGENVHFPIIIVAPDDYEIEDAEFLAGYVSQLIFAPFDMEIHKTINIRYIAPPYTDGEFVDTEIYINSPELDNFLMAYLRGKSLDTSLLMLPYWLEFEATEFETSVKQQIHCTSDKLAGDIRFTAPDDYLIKLSTEPDEDYRSVIDWVWISPDLDIYIDVVFVAPEFNNWLPELSYMIVTNPNFGTVNYPLIGTSLPIMYIRTDFTEIFQFLNERFDIETDYQDIADFLNRHDDELKSASNDIADFLNRHDDELTTAPDKSIVGFTNRYNAIETSYSILTV